MALWHWDIACSFWRYQNKRQSRDTHYGAKEGNYSSIWCEEGTSSTQPQSLASLHQRVRQSVVYTLLWTSHSFHGCTAGAKEVRKECKTFPLFVPGAVTNCFDFSLGLMQLNRIILPPGSPCHFVYELSKLFFWFLKEVCRIFFFLFIP